MRFLYFLFFVFLECNFLFNKIVGLTVEEIIGGEEAELHQFKYQVAIMYDPQLENVPHVSPCSGAIINEWFISTVAHCFFDESGEIIHRNFYIMASVLNISNPTSLTQFNKIEFVIMPNYYNPKMPRTYATRGNLAIVRVADRFKVTTGHPYIKKLKLAGRTFRGRNESFIVSSYGWNIIVFVTDIVNETVRNYQLGDSDGKLRFANARLIDDAVCQKQILRDNVARGNICVRIKQTPNEHKGICNGDSGAPLVRGNEYLSGLAINGFDECNENQKPAAYINIPYYLNFIKSIIAGKGYERIRVFQLDQTNSTTFRFTQI